MNPLLQAQLEALSELGDAGAVERLLSNLDDVNPGLHDSYCLAIAANQGHVEVVRLLLPHCDPIASDALREAAVFGNAAVVQLLIPVSEPKANNSMALHVAIQSHDLATVRLLLPVSDMKTQGIRMLRQAGREFSSSENSACRSIVEETLPWADVEEAFRESIQEEKWHDAEGLQNWVPLDVLRTTLARVPCQILSGVLAKSQARLEAANLADALACHTLTPSALKEVDLHKERRRL